MYSSYGQQPQAGYGAGAPPASYSQPVASGSYGYPGQQPQASTSYGSYAAPPAQHGSYGSGSSYPPPAAPYAQQQSYPPPQPQHQPHLQQYHRSTPPPQQQPSRPYGIESNPEAFRAYFSHELRQLTFNSKPIINALTIAAHENVARMAPVVAECLEMHIKQAPPQIKLPALYLLDSICKNLGPPYTELFAGTIDRIFLTAYREVEGSTKMKLEELLATWRTGGRDGGELFKLPPNAPYGTLPPQRIMEEALFGRQAAFSPAAQSPYSNGNASPPAPQQPQIPRPGPNIPMPPSSLLQPQQSNLGTNVEKAAVLHDLRRLLGIRREQAAQNPMDTSNRDQIATLQQLEMLVTNTQLNSAQINQIRDQLSKLTPPNMPQIKQEQHNGDDQRGKKRQRLMSPPPPVRSTPPPPEQSLFPMPPSHIIAPPPPALAPPNINLASLSSLLNPDVLRSASAQGLRTANGTPVLQQTPHIQAPRPMQAPTSSLAQALAGLDSSLLSTFGQAGAPPVNTDPTSSNPTPAPAIPAISEQAARDESINESALIAYEQHRLHFVVRLHNSEIVRYRPGSSALLYEAMPLRCKQCGNRYLDCPLGKERLDKDLDRHLRITRRYTEGVGAQRAVGRSWFTDEEEWITPTESNVPTAADVKTEEAKKQAAATAEILNKTVPVPPAALNAKADSEVSQCPICKEHFKNEYSEEEEDWVWRNAVEIDGKIYHASCKAEQSA